MREQRTREEILQPLSGFYATNGKESWPNDSMRLDILCELQADCRDLLQKLVDKKERTKVISTEVPMTEKEKQLLDGLDVIES